jgi:hypothetical protein
MYTKEKHYRKLETIKRLLRAEFDNKKIKYKENELESVSKSVHDLNLAIVKGWYVEAVCIKEPRGNLDTGRHYFNVMYATKDRQVTKFWPGGNSQIAKYFGMVEWKRDWSLPKWSFSSGAIGMSRKLGATDGLFYRLEKLGLTYVQL